MAPHGQVLLREASDIWRCLRGVFCIYKPARLTMEDVCRYIPQNITRDLNQLQHTVPKYRVEIKGSLAGNLTVSKTIDYSTHPLVLGDNFEMEDIKMSFLQELPTLASGVCVLGINNTDDDDPIETLRNNQLLSTYICEGKLGVATRDYFYTGTPVERSSWAHVTRGRLERTIYLLQSNHHRRMIDQLGLRPNSQAAYEAMSAEGLVRPESTQEPILYAIKIVDIGLPHFTIEVTGVNVTGEYLLTVVNDIGLMVKSNAHTLQLRCIRQGPFTLDLSLLRKHWTLTPVLENIKACRKLTAKKDNEHVSLRSLEEYTREQKETRQIMKDELIEKQKALQQISMRMIEEFKENEEAEKYLKSLEDHQGTL